MHAFGPRPLALVMVLLFGPSAWAVKPAESLLPDTTCLYVSFPDMNAFRTNFDATQLGKLARDPIMKPFAEDLGNQLRDRFGDTKVQLGLRWEDLKGVYAGEACLARVQPSATAGKHATALLIDVTGKDAQVAKVRATISNNMKQREAEELKEEIAGAQVTVYKLKREIGEVEQRQVFLTIVDNQFILINHRQELEDLLHRAKGDVADASAARTIKEAVSFSQVMATVAANSTEDPDVRWFVDPFTYAEVVRSARGGKRRRGKDLRQILQSQGFDAIKAMGGHLNLATGGVEVLHRTAVYAPPVTTEASKYEKAARMLQFPAAKHIPTEPWIPRKLATFSSFNWKIRDAFEYSISLIDAYVDSENFVEDVLEDFKTAKEGPQIDIRTELLDHLGEHVITFSDYKLPMTTKSERLVVGIRVKNEEQVAAALQKLWLDGEDPTVEKRIYKERVIWEIVPEEDDLDDINLVGGASTTNEVPAGGPPPNAAMTVARGYLLVSTHLDYLQSVLDDRQPFDSLQKSADFTFLNKKLNDLGGGNESFRFFARTDEEYESAYEMIRQGKMPESESMLGRVLNRFLGPEEEGVLRKQQLDGSKMPPYEAVRKYLGPAGAFVTTRKDGWFVTGVVLDKNKLVNAKAGQADASATSAQATTP